LPSGVLSGYLDPHNGPIHVDGAEPGDSLAGGPRSPRQHGRSELHRRRRRRRGLPVTANRWDASPISAALRWRVCARERRWPSSFSIPPPSVGCGKIVGHAPVTFGTDSGNNYTW